MKNALPLLKQTFQKWNQEEPFRLSAVIAYYAIFSLPALLIIVINVAGAVFGEQNVSDEVFVQINEMMGADAAENVRTMIGKASETSPSVIGNIIGIGTLLFGATGVFYQLQISLNQIWNVESNPKSSFLGFLMKRALSLGMILVIGLLLLITLVVSTALSVLSEWIKSIIPDVFFYLSFVLNFIISFGIITVLFALIFKVMPDVEIKWRTVWTGAFVTAFLFVVGKFGLSFYFGESDPASVYGAAGTIILILLWVYYSCLILFFGASFTFVYAQFKHYPVEPSKYAVKVKRIKVTQKPKESGEPVNG
jgi:membrane protein